MSIRAWLCSTQTRVAVNNLHRGHLFFDQWTLLWTGHWRPGLQTGGSSVTGAKCLGYIAESGMVWGRGCWWNDSSSCRTGCTCSSTDYTCSSTDCTSGSTWSCTIGCTYSSSSSWSFVLCFRPHHVKVALLWLCWFLGCVHDLHQSRASQSCLPGNMSQLFRSGLMHA